MAKERMDVYVVREAEGKSYFERVGVAFPNRDGKGFNVQLNLVPAMVDGNLWNGSLVMRDPLGVESETRG
jgi:hypothetical protein